MVGRRSGGMRIGGPIVGRDAELAAIRTALDKPPAMVLIEGEAGIGKSRLLAECRDDLDRFRIAEAVCPPLPEPFPLGPMVDALHRLPLRLDELTLSPLAGALRALFPEWAEWLPRPPEPLEDPRATRHRLFRAMAELVNASGVDALVIEDAHWADPATLEFLLMLVAVPERPPSLILTYRPTDVPADSALLRLTGRAPASMTRLTVTLEPLDLEAATRLVRATAGVDRVSTEFVELLHERTGGVPLALEECVRLLLDRGDLTDRPARGEDASGADPVRDGWTPDALDPLQVPPTVRDSVLERAARLEPDARRMIEAAAVLTEPADESLLGRVADLDPGAARRGLAEALRSGLVHEAGPGRVVCRHQLAARAIEGAMPSSERRRLHHHAGNALGEVDPPPVARLVRHFREADAVDDWCRYAEAAADLALASGEDRSAVLTLHEVLTGAQHPADRRARLARKLGEAAAWGVAGLLELGTTVTETLSTVLESDELPAEERGEIRLLVGRLWLQLGEFDAAAAQIEAAAGELGSRPEVAARAMMSLALPRGRTWPASRHLGWLARATDLLPGVESDADRIWLAVDRATVLLMFGDPDGWTVIDRLDPDPGSPFERRQVARARMNAGHFAIAWGLDSRARTDLSAADAEMRATDYRRLLNSVGLTTTHLDWRSGHWNGLADRVRALADADDTLPEARLEARLVLALLAMAAGDRAAAMAGLVEVLDETTRRGLVDAHATPAAALGRLHLAGGDPAATLAVTSPTVELIGRKGLWLWATDLFPVHVDALIANGRADLATGLVQRFAAGVHRMNAPAPVAALLVCRGIVSAALDRHDQAAEHFAQAARDWAALPRPYEELLTIERQADALLAAGRVELGLRILESTRQRLLDLGARWDAERVAHTLRRHGVEVARPWRGGRRGYGDRLSPRELQVARMVARGLTNRQVATELFLSPRTVDHHLSAAMRKLGVPTRTALAAALSDAPAADRA